MNEQIVLSCCCYLEMKIPKVAMSSAFQKVIKIKDKEEKERGVKVRAEKKHKPTHNTGTKGETF